jgi:hypothetical protein
MASTAYISASTNRFPGVADVSRSLVAFGSGRFVALWSAAVRDAASFHPMAPLPHESDRRLKEKESNKRFPDIKVKSLAFGFSRIVTSSALMIRAASNYGART